MNGNKRKRPNKSDIKRIRAYWSSDEGQARLEAIDEKLGTHIGVRVNLALSQSKSLCWACLKPKSRRQRCHIIPDCCDGPAGEDNLILMCYGCHLDSPTVNHPDAIWVWMNEASLFPDEFQTYLQRFIDQSNLTPEGIEQVLYHPDKSLLEVYPGAAGISVRSFYSIWVIEGRMLEESRPDLVKA